VEVEKIHLTRSNTMHRKCQFQRSKKSTKINDLRPANSADSWAILKNLQTESRQPIAIDIARLDPRVPFLVRWLFPYLYLCEERSARFLSRRERFNIE
jgi:antitoxin HicB